jgi:hypothetical protein
VKWDNEFLCDAKSFNRKELQQLSEEDSLSEKQPVNKHTSDRRREQDADEPRLEQHHVTQAKEFRSQRKANKLLRNQDKIAKRCQNEAQDKIAKRGQWKNGNQKVNRIYDRINLNENEHDLFNQMLPQTNVSSSGTETVDFSNKDAKTYETALNNTLIFHTCGVCSREFGLDQCRLLADLKWEIDSSDMPEKCAILKRAALDIANRHKYSKFEVRY